MSICEGCPSRISDEACVRVKAELGIECDRPSVGEWKPLIQTPLPLVNGTYMQQQSRLVECRLERETDRYLANHGVMNKVSRDALLSVISYNDIAEELLLSDAIGVVAEKQDTWPYSHQDGIERVESILRSIEISSGVSVAEQGVNGLGEEVVIRLDTVQTP